jgi:hypothetical protein
MAYELRRRAGTEGFYLDLNGKQIGQIFAPIADVEAAETWVISIDPIFACHEDLPPPHVNFFREFPTLEAAADFIGAEVPEATVYVPWSYQDGFVSGVAA